MKIKNKLPEMVVIKAQKYMKEPVFITGLSKKTNELIFRLKPCHREGL